MTLSPSDSPQEPAALPIGMFDSGMGGLTVLHECLVQLPGEHFAYVGDTARFPYGEKSREQLELFSRQITAFLETVPVKLIVVACYSATSAALPVLQERVRDADHRRGHAGRASRGGDLALPQDRRAGHGGDGGERRVSARDPQPRLRGRGHPAGVPRPGRLHRGRGRRQPGARRRRARLHRAAQGAAAGRGHHGLHALPADRAHAAALPGARRHAHQPGRRDRPGGRGHAPAAGPRSARARSWAPTASTPPATPSASAARAPASCRCRSRACARCRSTRLDELVAP